MAQNGRLQNRAYSPYAVDSVEFQDLSEDPSSSYPNAAYQNLDLAKSQEDLSRNLSTFKGSYQNAAYENSEVAHQYEDPAHLVAAATSASTGPRRKRNELYEPTEIRKEDEEGDNEDYSDGIAGDSWLSRLILFLILMVSLAALLLVVLIILGKVGPSCSCSKEQAPRGAQLSGSESTTETSQVVAPSPPDVSSLENKINEVKRNITLIKAFMNTLQRDIQGTKGDLTDTNKNINGTKDKLSQIESGTQDSINKIQNISQQLDASVSAINVSFFQELASMKTSFDSKLNNTAQNLLDADNSLQSLLNTINSSLSAKVQSINKLRGPTGPSGFNGSIGDAGQQGVNGSQGIQGLKGDKGDSGVKGDPGVNGTDGVDGQKGDTGAQGNTGDQGAQGPKGEKGATGPQGPQGAGNFSQCVYEEVLGTEYTPDRNVVADATLVESEGKKILGVSCSTTRASEYNLSVVKATSGPNSGKYIFTCSCRGDSSLFTAAPKTRCILHYWECPLTT